MWTFMWMFSRPPPGPGKEHIQEEMPKMIESDLKCLKLK
jgi:hypothetical protein